MLDFLSDRTGDEETVISFTATATDPDPGQSRAFSLLGAPADAMINTNTGPFAWTPSEAQGPSTNFIAVLVTDNGTPSLSATSKFTIVVREVNRTPTLAPIDNRIVVPGDMLMITVAASDADLPLNTLRYSMSGLPSAPASTPGREFSPGSRALTTPKPRTASPSWCMTMALQA